MIIRRLSLTLPATMQATALHDARAIGEAIAVELSRRIECIIDEAFGIASSYSFGNPFAIANKLLDHVMAYGDESETHDPPLLTDGNRLNMQDVARAVSLLRKFESMPTMGYMND